MTSQSVLSIGTAIALMIAVPAVASAETYTYDAAGRLTGVFYDNGTGITYTYDAAGNILEEFAGEIDIVPPSPPDVTGATSTNDATPTWNWSAGGGGNGTYRYKLDDGDLSTGATETTATSHTPAAPLSDGAHTLYVQEHDAAGNWSTSGSWAITVDTTAPSTTATPAGGSYPTTQSVTLSCDDGAGAGCLSTHFTTDGSDPTTSSTEYTTAISISADATLKFFSVDEVGNSEAVTTESYVVETTAANNPPAAFDLVYPADGQIDVPVAPKFIWKRAIDPDGDDVSYQVTTCENPSFDGCAPQTVALALHTPVTYAFAGVWLLALAVLSVVRFPKTATRLIAALALVTFFAGAPACSGDEPDPRPKKQPIPGADEASFDVSGLSAGTTYYWKVTANDGNGGSTESATWTFTTVGG